MINHNKKFIFIHIPRCGGNFINHFFDPSYIQRLQINKNFKDASNYETDHYPLNRYLTLFPESLYYFKFSFVRNPWSKVVSEFFFKKYGKHRGGIWGPCDRLIDCANLEFPEFVKELEKKFHLIGDLKDKNQYEVSHFMTFKQYFGHTEDINFIGKMENFDKDFLKLCELLRIPFRSLRPTNSVDRLHYTEYYSDTSRDIIGELYEEDIKEFGYKFGE